MERISPREVKISKAADRLPHEGEAMFRIVESTKRTTVKGLQKNGQNQLLRQRLLKMILRNEEQRKTRPK